jgi:energy-coupling factor transport system permease protein
VSVAERRTRAPRREPELTFLRLVPGTSPMHRLWAGTKILVAAALALMVSISPSWAMIGVAGAVVVLELAFGRIPPGAFPRLPSWFFGLVGISAVLSLWSSTEPVVHVGGIALSMGGLEQWARFTVLAVVLVVSGAVIGWTTPLGEIAPALARLGRPLRWVRVPVDEWALAVALAIRCLPLLIDEIRVLGAARRLRTHDEGREAPRAAVQRVLIEMHDLMATAIVASIRRARDLADAIEARGGLADAVVLVGLSAVCVVTLAVLHL